jgi:hypothetical protein
MIVDLVRLDDHRPLRCGARTEERVAIGRKGWRAFAGPDISPGAKISGAGADKAGAAVSCVGLAKQVAGERCDD